jgi:hypothetical protein
MVVNPKIPTAMNVKVTFDGTSGYGADMLPTETANDIIKRVFDRSWARQAIMAVNQSTEDLNLPKFTSGITMYGTSGNKNVAATETRQGTDTITLSMKTIIANVPVDKKTLAYAVPSTFAIMKEDIANQVNSDEENMFVNGDTTAGAGNINGAYHAVNFPNGIVTQDVRLEFNGFRKFAKESAAHTVNASGAALTSTHVRKALANLGIYANSKSDIIILVSKSVEATMYGWEELITLEKYGPKATIFTGEIGKVFGCTVIGTDKILDTLDTAGVARNQGSGSSADDRSLVLVFNKMGPVIGNPSKNERKFKIDIDDEPTKDRIVLVPKEDLSFANRYDEAFCQIINVLPGTL